MVVMITMRQIGWIQFCSKVMANVGDALQVLRH